MNEILFIAGMALVTFAVRYPVLALVGKIPLPISVLRALNYVPPAVLTAIIVPAMVFTSVGVFDSRLTFGIAPMTSSSISILDLRLTNSYLVAGVVAALIAWRSKNLLLTIILGMGALWFWRWLLASLTP